MRKAIVGLEMILTIALFLILMAHTVKADPWTVFAPADSTLPMGGNLLQNADFEAGAPGSATEWNAYGLGYSMDETGGMSATRGLMLENPVETQTHGATQTIWLNQTIAKPLYFCANSRCLNLSGEEDSDYSFYLDVYYIDDTPLYGQVLSFPCGTTGWEFREGFIFPEKPIRSVSVYCLLRNTHSGTVWFDNLAIREVDVPLLDFDTQPVAAMIPSEPPYGGDALTLSTANGLDLTFSSDGGVISTISLQGEPVTCPESVFASGFFIRDVAAAGDFVHPGGTLVQNNQVITETAVIPELAVNFSAAYTGSADCISVHAEVENTQGVDRALSIYFALPIQSAGWVWDDDIRNQREIAGTAEFSNQSWWSGLGATGTVSRYPMACVHQAAGGLVLACPPDSPRVLRLNFNPVSGQFYIVFDVAVSADTTAFPNTAWVDFCIYPDTTGRGFRAAAQGYYNRFSQEYQVRIPAQNQGIWVAFADISGITDIEDFGIAFHELGSTNQIAFDDQHGIYSFRYVSEPWSHWLPIDDPGVDPDIYSEVIAYVHDLNENGTAAQQRITEATLCSGFFDELGQYRYESTMAPWCEGVAGCAVFTLNPDPDVTDASYPLNKAHLDWGDSEHATYDTYPGLDGEYIDSYLSNATELDYRTSHFAAANIPLTFSSDDFRPGIPEVFATFEFAQWLSQDVHDNLGKWTMANGILLDMPWGTGQFDFMGREADWFPGGTFQPVNDRNMNYYRTLAGPKPYGFLMNSNFDLLTYDLTEKYFQICTFYGIYPSFFSHNASAENYFENPVLFERDRPMFIKYIPLIRTLNAAGWQPVTGATAEPQTVYIERYGNYPDLYFTLRNTTGAPVTVSIHLDSEMLNLPAGKLTANTLFNTGSLEAEDLGTEHLLELTLPSEAVEIIQILPMPLPDLNRVGFAVILFLFTLALLRRG